MSTFRLKIVVSIILIFLFFCSDPKNPFIIDNVRLTSVFPGKTNINGIIIGDSLTIGLAIQGVEFVDSLRTKFENDSAIWHNDTKGDFWSDTIWFNYKCKATGNACFYFHGFLKNQSLYRDSTVLNVRGKPALLMGQSGDTIVDERTLLRLFVKAAGSDTIRYQWFKNGILLSGHTDETFSIASTSSRDSGVYTCVVNNGWGRPDTSKPAKVSVLHINRPPSIVYDTSIIRVRETDSVRVIVKTNDPDNDMVQLVASNIDSLKLLGENILSIKAGDSTIFVIKPAWKPGHASRQFTLNAVFGDGFAFDTAHLRFSVADSNMAPLWKTNPLAKTVNAGEEISLALGPMLNEPDGDPLDLLLLEGSPDNDMIAENGSTYSLKAVYAAAGQYTVKIVARDFYGASDTLTINLTINNKK